MYPPKKAKGTLKETNGIIFFQSIILFLEKRNTFPQTTIILHNKAVALIWVNAILVSAKIAK